MSRAVLSPWGLRQRFARDLPWVPEVIHDRRPGDTGIARPAAVLVPIVLHGSELHVLFTTRPGHLRSHSGQIAFPGGRVEVVDADRRATTLRETREEIGLSPTSIEILGQLPEYGTGSGFSITPVIGLIESLPALDPDPNEVEEVFHVPLTFLMDPANHQRRRVLMAGEDRQVYAMPWRAADGEIEYFIWGVTATILRNFFHFLRAD
ncbi:MAG: CoA pyrophosphatase [Burkholderiaceae bacterium]